MSKLEDKNQISNNFDEIKRFLNENLKLSTNDQVNILNTITDCLDRLVPLSGCCEKLTLNKLVCGIPIDINLFNHKLTVTFPNVEPLR